MTKETGSGVPAVEGGPPVRSEPWPPRRLFGEEEKRAVGELFDRCIASGEAFGYNGPEEEAFCKEFAEFQGGGFADAVNSGTNAVWIALRALEIEPGREVIVPPVSDPGGVMPVALCNCIPVAADSAPNSFNVGAEQIAARLSHRTAAVIVAHIAGIPSEMDSIMELARSRNIPVVEDCAQAPGALYKGRKVGCFGDVAAFSTMFGKHLATGGQGGVVFTRSEEVYWRVRRLADRGKPFGIEGVEENVVAALNCNMDELHAAIGRVQLRKLPGVLARRRRLAAAIESGCRERLETVRLATGGPECESAYWFMFFRVDFNRLNVDKAGFLKGLEAEGVPFRGSYLVTPARMEWFRNKRVFGRTSELPWSLAPNDSPADRPTPNIEAADEAHVSLAVHENFTDADVESILAALEKVERAYIK